LLAVADAAGGSASAAASGPTSAAVPLLADPDGRVANLLKPADAEPGASFLVVLCPNQHLLGVFAKPLAQFDSLVSLIGREARHFRSVEGTRHAPVLQIPQVLSAEDCKHLIAIFNTEGNVFVEPGHGDKAMTQDYKMRIPEYGRHDRIDHWVMNEATVRFINERLKRRLLPEVRKAFAYAITRHESYRITKYEGERGGELHGHRDNSELRVAHRRFALSINLNSEQFEGGGLRFPEFGGQIYRPPSGTALLFSSGLLHEAMHVTKGRRFVLLGFMFGET
jgi:predicted 2-oxoglutarate/Fe(II)-dependent dioxygenase YbiX